MNLIGYLVRLLGVIALLGFGALNAQTVTTPAGLASALTAANGAPSSPAIITLAAGTYNLTTALPDLAANNLTLNGPASGAPAILDATSLASGVIFNVTADQVTISNITLRDARKHAITIQPGADNGRIEDCTFTNPTVPHPTTAAIDGNDCAGWTITGNTLSGIIGTAATAEPAIHFYGGASSTTVTNNLIQNCDRAIALGGDPAAIAPTLGNLTPASGAVGTTVTFTGSNFTSLSVVKFNGTTAISVTVVSSTSITAVVPSGATTGTISVTTAGGTATSTSVFTVTSQLSAQIIQLIRTRLEEQGRAENATGGSTITSWLGTLQADGSWPDLNYSDQSRNNWSPCTHVQRLARMAAAYRTTGNTYYQSDVLLQAFSKALDYWIQAKLVCPNWWYNDIGVPMYLGPALLMMQPRLSSAQLSAGAALIQIAPMATGQNRVWYCGGAIHRALLEGNTLNLQTAVDGIQETLVLTTTDGIQVDGTFYQHGNEIYNGGYGLGLISDVSKWVAIFGGTPAAIEGIGRTNLDNLVLDGTGWMLRYGYIDYSTLGRQTARKGSGNIAANISASVTRLISAGSSRLSDLQALSEHIASRAAGPVGQKHFWRGDYTVQRNSSSLVSLRCFSSRTIGAEVINGENLLGYYQPFGLTLIYRDGLEYSDIFPAWNWQRLPGTTVEQTTAIPSFTGGLVGTQTFVGGVSDGQAGMSAFVQTEPASHVKAKKSWFFFGQGFLALGSGIQSSGTGMVSTTLNQCLLRSGVRVSQDGAINTLAAGDADLNNVDWVLHDSVGYVLPTAATVHLKNTTQSGNWHLISDSASTTTVSCSVFQLGLDHGTSPTNANYAYIVLPGVDETGVTAFRAQNPITILSNTTAIQAARHSGLKLSGIAFFSAGSIAINSSLTVTVSIPALLMIRETDTGLEISLSDPTQKLSSAQVTLSGKYSGTGAVWNQATNNTVLTVSFPTSAMAGSSTKILLAK